MFAIVGWILCLCIALLAFFGGYAVLKVAFGFGSVNKQDYWLGYGLLVIGGALIGILIKYAPFSVNFSYVA